MASLTPLSKGLIGLAIVGAVVSAIWNLGLKEHFSNATAPAAPTTGPVAVAPSTAAPSLATAAAPTSVPPIAEPRSASPAPPSATPIAPGKAITAAESGEKGRQFLDAGDFSRARTFLEQAVKMGDGPAACHLGEMTLKGQGGIAPDREKSASLFQLAQSRGMICFASGK